MNETKKRNVKLLGLIHVSDSSIFLWPVVILFYYKVAGSAAGAGVLLSARSITSAVCELPLGLFSDRFGRAWTTRLATATYLVSAVLTAISWRSGFITLLFAVVIQGLAEASESGNHDALLYESSPSKDDYEKRSAWLGTLGSVFGMISAVVGGFMGSKSLLLVAVASVIPRAISALASTFVRDVRETDNSNISLTMRQSMSELWRVLAKNRQVRLVLTGKMVADGFGEVSWQFRALFVQTVWPIWAIGLSMPLSHGAQALGGVIYAKNQHVIKKYGPLRTMLVTALASRSILVVSYLLQSVFSPFLISVAGIGTTFSRVSFSRFLHGRLHDDIRASGFSVFGLITTGLFSVTSILFGLLIDEVGVRWTLVAVSVCALASTIFYKLALNKSTKLSS